MLTLRIMRRPKCIVHAITILGLALITSAGNTKCAKGTEQYPLTLYKTIHLVGNGSGTLGIAWTADSKTIAISHGPFGGEVTIRDVASGRDLQDIKYLGMNDGSLFFLPNQSTVLSSIAFPAWSPGTKETPASSFLSAGLELSVFGI